MATEKGQKIVDYAISKIGCAYIYGGYGEKKCTPSFRKERAGAYPDYKANMYKYCPVLSGKQSKCTGCKYDGKQAYDCAQLTRYCGKAAGQELVSGANSQWTKMPWEKKGEIGTLPDVPGVFLYHKNSSGRMSHTGVYIGGGYAVEARGHAYGVVKTKVAARSWTHWAALPGVLSPSDGAPEKVEEQPAKPQTPQNSPGIEPDTGNETQGGGKEVQITLTTLRSGTRGKQVKRLQQILMADGFLPAKSDDGIFGNVTKSAVMSFQTVNGLTVDGIAGKNTLTKLYR